MAENSEGTARISQLHRFKEQVQYLATLGLISIAFITLLTGYSLVSAQSADIGTQPAPSQVRPSDTDQPTDITDLQIEGGRDAVIGEFPAAGRIQTTLGSCSFDKIGDHSLILARHCVSITGENPTTNLFTGTAYLGHPDVTQQVASAVPDFVVPMLRFQERSGNHKPEFPDVAIGVVDTFAGGEIIAATAVPITKPRTELQCIQPTAKGFGWIKLGGPITDWLQIYDGELSRKYHGDPDCQQDYGPRRTACLFEVPNNPAANIIIPGDSGGGVVSSCDAAGNQLTDTTEYPIVGINASLISGTHSFVTDLTDPTLNAELKKTMAMIENYYMTQTVWTEPVLPHMPISDTVTSRQEGDELQLIHTINISPTAGVDAWIANLYLNTVPFEHLRDCPVTIGVETSAGGNINPFRGFDGQQKADIIALEGQPTTVIVTQTIAIDTSVQAQACAPRPDQPAGHGFTTRAFGDVAIQTKDGRVFQQSADTMPVAAAQLILEPRRALLPIIRR